MKNKEGRLVCVKEEGTTTVKKEDGSGTKEVGYKKIYRLPLESAKDLIDNQSNKEGEPTYTFTTKGAWRTFVKVYNKQMNKGRAIQIRIRGLKGRTIRAGGGNGKSTKGSKHNFIKNKRGKMFKVKCN